MLVVSVSTPGDIQMPAKFAARPVMHGSSCAQKLVSQYDGGERRLRSKQSLVSLEVGPTGTRESEAQLLKLIRLGKVDIEIHVTTINRNTSSE